MIDNRAKIPDELIDALLPDEKLHGVLKFIKLNGKLHLCFRGNSTPPVVIVYYNNHVVLRISYLRGGLHKRDYKIEVSANHAKNEEKITLLNKLRDEYKFEIPKDLNTVEDINKISYPYRYINPDEKLTDTFFASLCELMIKIMDKYFGEDNAKSNYVEKKRQHELFTALTNVQNCYYVYDLEFSQKYESQDARDEDIKNQNVVLNHPDMLGIRYDNGVPKALALIEVKSTKSACNNKKTGLDKHINGMKAYINSTHMEDRKNEASNIIRHYKKLDIRKTPKYIPDFTKLVVNYEIVVILTDEAIKYYEDKYIKKGISLNDDITSIYKWTNNKLIPMP